ncbi:hypothetical protein HYX10_05035 [Candidatus Woesearchaeota archaeon]|nr:hypothetical protein [Candidatus Woesearchaeota archaeon]
MRSVIATVILLAVVTIISACSPGEGQTPSTFGFVGGNDGVTLKFLDNNPPAKAFDAGPTQEDQFKFNAIVSVENVGEYTINPGGLKLSLKGFFPEDFGVAATEELTQSNTQTLTAVSKNNQGDVRRGTLEQITFPKTGEFAYRQDLSVDQTYTFTAEACYKYETKTVSQICLKEDLRSSDTEICNPIGNRQVSNSGAPVHITAVRQDVAGTNSVVLDFEVKKAGTADIFYTRDPTQRPKCQKSDQLSENRVKVTVTTNLGNPDSINCLGLTNVGADKGSGELILNNGAATFSCIQNLEGVSFVDSIKTFTAALEYDVRETIETNVLVEDIQ